MQNEMEQRDSYISILNEELILALGCTEPASIAFLSAITQKYLEEKPIMITIECSSNIIKNVHGVIIPNTQNKKGIKYAVAAGFISKAWEQELQILKKLDNSKMPLLDDFVRDVNILIETHKEKNKVYIKINAISKSNNVTVELEDNHTNITSIIKNNVIIVDNQKVKRRKTKKRDKLTFDSIIKFANTLPFDMIPKCIDNQIKYNYEIAEYGLNNNYKINIGKSYLRRNVTCDDNKIIALTAAASEARMSGCELPVIINSGSGNQGIVVSVPVIAYATINNCSYENLCRALLISNLFSIHEKESFQRLSSFCGVTTAAAAAGAGITWLKGGTVSQIKGCVSNTFASIAGIFCDGAKPSCAFKVATGVETALVSSSLSLDNCVFSSGEGIIKADLEETVKCTGKIVREGMKNTDFKILEVMLSQ